jgi:hypothetical protein
MGSISQRYNKKPTLPNVGVKFPTLFNVGVQTDPLFPKKFPENFIDGINPPK